MDALTKTLARLSGARVHGLHVPAYLDGKTPVARAVTTSYTLYFELDEGFLRLTWVGSGGGLQLAVASEAVRPDCWDEDDDFLLASIGELFFDNGGSAPLITRIRYATNAESDPDRGIVRCAEFQLGLQNRLFCDPSWVPGIRLSTSGGYEQWQREDRDRERDLHGFVHEHVWEPARR
ncbi:hypothetical protein [Couchioplanes azureus]|uniref:hypothetical protein n=1 Tax=Couchioplanes caeruleus TaxID=56438 RepID=UPI00167065DE|nr:hypothetical protein [Couchioplanes caeruleus]GGQ65438.1 hypothetical protein GCM10010166_38820 [Couchioplanes caeruleus subsp. azureus]